MSRLGRSERNSKNRRPRRSASNTHIFKYQLSGDPRRAEESELKRALQQSIEDQIKCEIKKIKVVNTKKKCDDSYKSNKSSSNINVVDDLASTTPSPTQPPLPTTTTTASKHTSNNIVINDNNNHINISNGTSPSSSSYLSSFMSSSSSTSTSEKQPQSTTSLKQNHQSLLKQNHSQPQLLLTQQQQQQQQQQPQKQKQQQQLLKQQKNHLHKKQQPQLLKQHKQLPQKQQEQHQHHQQQLLQLQDGNKNGNHSKLTAITCKRKSPSWSLVGQPEEKYIIVYDDQPPRKVLAYSAIKHVKGDIINVRDSVLVKSGIKKTDLPFIAKICAFWKDLQTENVMMSLLWYYRPEHTEDGRKPNQLLDEVFASKHRDLDSVECIEDKCYVLTFNEYCRYRKRCKMEECDTNWSLTDRVIPNLQETYSRMNRIPDSSVSSELVFVCRQIYDSRYRKLIKNPLINSKYGNS